MISENMIKGLFCIASQDCDGDCYKDRENFKHMDDDNWKPITCGNCERDFVSGKKAQCCPYHQMEYGTCFEDGDLWWLEEVAEYVDMIDDEIESAKYFAEKYVECKAKGHESATRYKEFANDEIKHAMFHHDVATKEIDEISKVFTTPVEMQDKWNKSHKEYVERVAWIKQMLAM